VIVASGIDKLLVSVQDAESLFGKKGCFMTIDRKIPTPLAVIVLVALVAVLTTAAPAEAQQGAPAPGTFLGADLITEDAEKASRFYADLFPWDVEKVEEGGYRVNHNGRLIASISQIENSDNDVDRSFWLVALAVNDLKQTLRSAGENNATVLEKNTKVEKFGRFAVIADAEKAPVMFIQSGKTPIGGTTGHGSWVWAELWTDDIEKATVFYADVVGVGHDMTDREGRAYHLFTSQGKHRAGIVKIPDELEDVEPGWAPYVDVEDLDKTKDRVRELGGRVIFATDDNPVRGAVALIIDPTGAALFIHEIGSTEEVTE
jgi:predicted enzyme related to lactoylglutathione lyase